MLLWLNATWRIVRVDLADVRTRGAAPGTPTSQINTLPIEFPVATNLIGLSKENRTYQMSQSLYRHS